jgi:uncharacterized repeat protein (TIGR01451 family)
VTYTIILRNTGVPFYDTVRVTDTVPAGLSYVPGSLAASSGSIDASAAPTLKWSGTMSTTPTSIVTITYRALVTAGPGEIITNTAVIDPALNPALTRSATLLIGGPNLTASKKQVSAHRAWLSEVLTYTIVLISSGDAFTDTVRITDTLPAGLGYLPGSLKAHAGVTDDSAAPILKWSGVMSTAPVVTVTFAVSVATPNAAAIVNTATIHPGYGAPFTRDATIVVNPFELFLPLILRSG